MKGACGGARVPLAVLLELAQLDLHLGAVRLRAVGRRALARVRQRRAQRDHGRVVLRLRRAEPRSSARGCCRGEGRVESRGAADAGGLEHIGHESAATRSSPPPRRLPVLLREQMKDCRTYGLLAGNLA